MSVAVVPRKHDLFGKGAAVAEQQEPEARTADAGGSLPRLLAESCSSLLAALAGHDWHFVCTTTRSKVCLVMEV